MTHWLCSQLGSREKYAIPRALTLSRQLDTLFTDMWIKPAGLVQRFNNRAVGRFHDELAKQQIVHFNRQFLARRIAQKVFKNSLEEDLLYDQLVASKLRRYVRKDIGNIFGYSYTSRLTFIRAKELGLKTVLGQINPGPAEAEIVTQAFRHYMNGRYKPHVPDEAYWGRWREEIQHADIVVVNSVWSKQLLLKEGVVDEKILVIPLAYEATERRPFRVFKKTFSQTDPLNLLYLGGIGIRKGFHVLTAAMKEMSKWPVHLHVVGALKGPEELLKNLPGNVTVYGAVPQHQVAEFYKKADVFIFPTLSDGFGLTQLEAQAYKLPIIASRFCAPVVTDSVNGIVLPMVEVASIVAAIEEILDTPNLIELFSGQSIALEEYSISNLSKRFAEIR